MRNHWVRFGVGLMMLLKLVEGVLTAGPLREEQIRNSISKALPLIEAGSKGSMAKRKQCFTCHNQGLPVMALTLAQKRGFEVDTNNLAKQVQFTAAFLEKNRTNYLTGRGQGGAALTAGYALWTLETGQWPQDATTDAVAEYLLLRESDKDHWKPQTLRPPTEGSEFASTYVAMRGLKIFGTAEQRERITSRIDQVAGWVAKTQAKDTEDKVFRLRTLQLLGASKDEIKTAAQDLASAQREDGGWNQLPEMTSDAYATSTALVALHQAGGMATTSDAVYHRGLRWLFERQLADGSWHVKTRSEPIQTYYESGYPHGEDQFISITAASWATIAFLLALPE